MRVVIQRVSRASVSINGIEKASIRLGMLILLGIEEADDAEDVHWLCGKIRKLRIFPDEAGVMNTDILEANGNILVVSQFTLHASTKKGNRPSYIRAARPEKAIPLYTYFLQCLENETGRKPECGEFGAMMEVSLINDGPVTILMDSKNKE